MERDQATRLMQGLLKKMVAKNGSDLFITAGFPPAIKIDGEIHRAAEESLTPDESAIIVRAIMNDKQAREFDATKECNFAIGPQGIGRFRVSAYIQQGAVAAVLRQIITKIPTVEELELPSTLKEIAMTKRGLVILVGATGSGKSTTLAAMIGHRNENSRGHIVTIEDPVEFVHTHKRCVVTHREVGVDTESWFAALKNTLRQAPDVIMIGEIRERETMEYGIQFAETGHLCLATLLNIQALISQRLVPREDGTGRVAAMEIMLKSPLISDLIFKGEVAKIKEIMAKSNRLGMNTFDQALFGLYEAHKISYEDAMRNADSKNELRLRIKLEGKRDEDNAEARAKDLSLASEEEGTHYG